MATETKRRSVAEVKFANHEHEFFRFYGKHKTFCDEIAGIKERVLIVKGVEEKFFIETDTFSFGIKRLSAFIIDSLQYIPDKVDRHKLKDQVLELEDRFMNDSDYTSLLSKSNRGYTAESALLKIYFKYLLECFVMGSELTKYLQYSLMIGTRDINKKLEYYNDNGIYKNLADYRDEVSDSLANFKLDNCILHVKQILGYYFTYKILMGKDETDLVDSIIPGLVDYCTDEELIKLIMVIRSGNKLSSSQLKEIKGETLIIKNLLSNIYFISNKALSEKRVLPKIEKRVFVDRSLI